MVVHIYVFTLRKAEKDLSDVAFVAGITSRSFLHAATAVKDSHSGDDSEVRAWIMSRKDRSGSCSGLNRWWRRVS